MGDILLAHWAKVNRPLWMAAGLGVWGVCLLLFALLMRHGGRSLGVTFTLSAVIHVALVLGWDLVMGETKATLTQWVGIGLAVAGVLLIEAGAEWRIEISSRHSIKLRYSSKAQTRKEEGEI